MNEPVTDRELLELVAQAGGCAYDPDTKCITPDGVSYLQWLPLADNDDAFRLAVNRGYSVKYNHALGQALVRSHLGETVENIEHNDGDKCAAVRRAIVRRAAEDVRAAAEIGRGLATNPDSEKS